MKPLYLAALSAPLTMMAACKPVVLAPAGDVAAQQRDVLLNSTYLMLLIIVPVLCLVVFFAWRYRASNTAATYDPEWSHSTRLELVIWAAPLLIVICLGGLTWVGTHLLDPYRPLDRITAGNIVTEGVEPLEVEVVSLDWKWLFIYPQYGIATVNELAVPVDRPVAFKLTSDSVMNAFYIPTMAGMIYTMAGMQTELNGVINTAGTYDGFSSNYSGAGFSGMRFKVHALDDAGFDGWVSKTRAAADTLDNPAYLALTKPSENVAPMFFGSVAPDLYHHILNMCTLPGQTCMDALMMRDAKTRAGAGGPHGDMHEGHDMTGMSGAGMSEAAMPGTEAMPATPAADAATARPAPHRLKGHGLSRDLVPLFGASSPTQDTH